MNRVCVICGKEFEGYGRQLSCSPECSEVRYRQILKRRSEKRKLPKVTKTCEWCGKEFVGYASKRFCCSKCNDKSYKARLKEELNAVREGNRKEKLELTKEQDAAFLNDVIRRQNKRKGDPKALERWTREARELGISLTEYRTAKDTMTVKRFEEWKQQKSNEKRKREFLKASGEINEV